MDALLRDLSHQLFWCASLIDNSNEILGESERNILNWMLEDVIHNMSKSIDKVITAKDQSFLLI
jgi:hypothetical protein